jgi:hypothetical protein
VIVTFPPERVMTALGPLAEPAPTLQPSAQPPVRGEAPVSDRITKAGT